MGIGTELTRKNFKGESIENDWNPKTAKLRIKGNPSSYKIHEVQAADKIHQIKDEIGRWSTTKSDLYPTFFYLKRINKNHYKEALCVISTHKASL